MVWGVSQSTLHVLLKSFRSYRTAYCACTACCTAAVGTMTTMTSLVLPLPTNTMFRLMCKGCQMFVNGQVRGSTGFDMILIPKVGWQAMHRHHCLAIACGQRSTLHPRAGCATLCFVLNWCWVLPAACVRCTIGVWSSVLPVPSCSVVT